MTEFTTWRSLVDGAEISAIPDAVVEDWERSNPLDDWSNDTAEFAVSTTDPIEGEASLESVNGNANTIITKSSGLEETPSKGRVFSSVLRDPGGGDILPGFAYGWGGSSGNWQGYEAFLVPSGDEVTLRRYDGGALGDSDSFSNILNVDFSASTQTAYEVEVEWHDGSGSEPDNEHVVTVYDYDTSASEDDARGAELGSASVNDDSYISGEIAVITESSGDAGVMHDRYWVLGDVE